MNSSKNRLVIVFCICFCLIIIFDILLIKNLNNKRINNNSEESNSIIKSNHINKLKSKIDNIILEKKFNQKYGVVYTYNNGRYNAYYFDYKKGKQVKVSEIVKDDFWSKVKEYLELKYPTFITSVVSKFDKTNIIIFNSDGIYIYFYDYDINPVPEEDIVIKINYEDIDKYLNFILEKNSLEENISLIEKKQDYKYVAFTFDDGPGKYTEELVNILNQNKANATFFIIGNKIDTNGDILKLIHDNENEIGYHSYAHKSFNRRL